MYFIVKTEKLNQISFTSLLTFLHIFLNVSSTHENFSALAPSCGCSGYQM